MGLDTEFDTAPDPVEVLAGRFARILGDPQVLALVAGERGSTDSTTGFALLTLRPTVWHDGPVAQLEELYVVPDRRGRGTGSALVADARRRLRDRGCPEVHANVDEVDHDARRFYERHGFVNVERESDGRILCFVARTEAGRQ
ncbi:N-acetyltransferase [Marmoricola endophyticus]|uniref:N-acetyltransferase n=1 Tax=Marmoricola endophyticus TaxID=2040280 RepID=A0A917F151_9ACTN|nr:N-acetyltransferase [Marmoricola endophyticus]